MKATVNDIVVDLAKVLNVLLGKETPCGKCGGKIKKGKSPLFVSGVGVLHDSCYREMVRECAAAEKA